MHTSRFKRLLFVLNQQISTVLQTLVLYFALGVRFAAALADIVHPNTAEAVPTECRIKVEINGHRIHQNTKPPQQQIYVPHRVVQSVVARNEPAQVESLYAQANNMSLCAQSL